MTYLLCLHRWVGNQALYDQYIAPGSSTIHAISSEEAVNSLPSQLASVSALPSMDDAKAVDQQVEAIVARHGPPSQIVALNEADLLRGAVLRERFGLPGPHLEFASIFRDKLRMISVAARQDRVCVLPSAAAENWADIERFAAQYGCPLVVKPRFGTASRGVRFVDTLDQPLDLSVFQVEPMMVQVRCNESTCHLDGWWDGTRIVVATASAYINNCVEFSPNSALGSVELPPGPEEDRLIDAATALLAVFAPARQTVFHLELFDTSGKPTFLEIGSRVGGAEIPFIWREVRNIDLVGIAFELQTETSQTYRRRALEESRNGKPHSRDRGGWVISRAQMNSQGAASSIYWSHQYTLANKPTGVYEGALTRVRLRSDRPDNLIRDVRSLVFHLSQ